MWGALFVAAVLCLASVATADPVTINIPTCANPVVSAAGASATIGCGGIAPPGPLVCTPPLVLNAAGNACVTPATVVCTPPLVLNATGNACVSPVLQCGVSGAVRIVDLDWSAPTRLKPEMAPEDAVVVRFTTGNQSTGLSLPRIAAAEWLSPPSARVAVLSSQPCDFGPQATPGATIAGNSVTAVFAIGGGNGFGYYPVLLANTTYYLNIKNAPNSTCANTEARSCQLFVDLIKVGGL